MNGSFIEVWRPTRIGVNEVVRRSVGPLSLWLKRTSQEWLLATRRVPEEVGWGPPLPGAPEPHEDEWLRWTAGDETSMFRLLPVMPNRPVVLRPESTLAVPPTRQALLFVEIPIWVRITAGAELRFVLREEPTVVLPRTWFGDLASGELCYALTTRARRSVSPADARIHRAVCPVRVQNAWTAPLEFDRLCVHVAHLSVYTAAAQLWTNEVRVTFRGPDDPCQVDYAEGAPSAETITGILGEPRAPTTRSLLQRSFAGLWGFKQL
ncbi:MAG TPA: hypothetical protein VNE39_17135 [Planctomycetota bacterium]|nr:hypothetical protein [Planctomycetota bacterium]